MCPYPYLLALDSFILSFTKFQNGGMCSKFLHGDLQIIHKVQRIKPATLQIRDKVKVTSLFPFSSTIS